MAVWLHLIDFLVVSFYHGVAFVLIVVWIIKHRNIGYARSSIWPIATWNKSFKVSQIQLALPFTLWSKVGKKHNDKLTVMAGLIFLGGHYSIILRGAFTLWQSAVSSIKHASALEGGGCKLLACSFGNVWGVQIPGIYLRFPASCCGLGWEDSHKCTNGCKLQNHVSPSQPEQMGFFSPTSRDQAFKQMLFFCFLGLVLLNN